MKNVPNAINVQEEVKDRKQTISQVTKKDDIPFELSEGEQIIKDLKNSKRQGYNNVNDILKAIMSGYFINDLRLKSFFDNCVMVYGFNPYIFICAKTSFL